MSKHEQEAKQLEWDHVARTKGHKIAGTAAARLSTPKENLSLRPGYAYCSQITNKDD